MPHASPTCPTPPPHHSKPNHLRKNKTHLHQLSLLLPSHLPLIWTTARALQHTNLPPSANSTTTTTVCKCRPSYYTPSIRSSCNKWSSTTLPVSVMCISVWNRSTSRRYRSLRPSTESRISQGTSSRRLATASGRIARSASLRAGLFRVSRKYARCCRRMEWTRQREG